VLSKEERKALCFCPHCASKQVAVVAVPGGWLELICDDCGEVWFYEIRTKRIS
jgi:hypothetical protein